MKYKNINSLLNNFGHSFCSDLNMIIDANESFDGFIYKHINRLLCEKSIEKIVINFSEEAVSPDSCNTKDLFASVIKYKTFLSSQAEKLGLDSEKILNVSLSFCRTTQMKKGYNFQCSASCQDDRGKTYEVDIKF